MGRGGAPLGNHNRRTHGLSHTRIDNIYKAMLSRCYKETNNRYKNYGAKGITVCDEWLKDKTKFFEWAFSNGYQDCLTIDRINPNGNYEPDNCRWVTFKEQNNNRTNNRFITLNGETKTLAQWVEKYGCEYNTVHRRLKMGQTPEEALRISV